MKFRRIIPIAFALTAAAFAAEAPLPIDEAIALALRQSKGSQISAFKTTAAEAGASLAKRQRYPHVEAFGLSGYYFRPLNVELRRGALTPMLDDAGRALGLGTLSTTMGPFPANDITLLRGSRTESIGGITILQPLSQLWKIDSGVRAARAEATVARHEGDRTRLQIRVAVEKLYAGLLLEDARHAALAAKVAYAESHLRDAENAASVGEVLEPAVLGLRAALIEARTNLTRSEQQRARLSLQLGDLIGRPGAEDIAIASTLPERAIRPLAYWLGKTNANLSRQVASATAEKARAGTRASRQAYIPEVSAFATGYAQDGLPLLPDHGGAVGVMLRWDILDFGRRSSEVARSRALERAAELDRDRIEEEAAREIRVAYQDLVHSDELIRLAEQAVAYRRSAADLALRSAERGVELRTAALETTADLRQSEADLLGARLQRHIALLQLYALVGE